LVGTTDPLPARNTNRAYGVSHWRFVFNVGFTPLIEMS